jgi:hypothetical protein
MLVSIYESTQCHNPEEISICIFVCLLEETAPLPTEQYSVHGRLPGLYKEYSCDPFCVWWNFPMTNDLSVYGLEYRSYYWLVNGCTSIYSFCYVSQGFSRAHLFKSYITWSMLYPKYNMKLCTAFSKCISYECIFLYIWVNRKNRGLFGFMALTLNI